MGIERIENCGDILVSNSNWEDKKRWILSEDTHTLQVLDRTSTQKFKKDDIVQTTQDIPYNDYDFQMGEKMRVEQVEPNRAILVSKKDWNSKNRWILKEDFHK